MCEEIIKLPIKLKDLEIYFHPETQNISLRQIKPNEIKLAELNPELSDLDNFRIELFQNVILEVDLIEKIFHWLKDLES